MVQRNGDDFGHRHKRKHEQPSALFLPCNVMQYEALDGQLGQSCVGVCCRSVVGPGIAVQFLFCALDVSVQHVLTELCGLTDRVFSSKDPDFNFKMSLQMHIASAAYMHTLRIS